MKKQEIDQIISRYIGHNLSPTDLEHQEISRRYLQLKKILEGNNIFQSGSYSRYTAVTPINDLDVIWVIPEFTLKKVFGENYVLKVANSDDINVRHIIQDLSQKLLQAYKTLGENVRIELQTHSVGIYFGEDEDFSIDVVPAIELLEKNTTYNTPLYKIPNIADYSHSNRKKIYAENEVLWIKSDPRGYKQQAKTLNILSNGVSRKSIKFVKKWRKSCKSDSENFKLKSFHIEIIVTQFLLSNPDVGLLDTIIWFYRDLPKFLTHPQIPDLADKNNLIDQYVFDLSDSERYLIRSCKDRAIIAIQSIESANSEKEIIEIIETLLANKVNGPERAPKTHTIDVGNTSKLWG